MQEVVDISIGAEHFCSWLEEVIVPVFNNEDNIAKFPQCVGAGQYEKTNCSCKVTNKSLLAKWSSGLSIFLYNPATGQLSPWFADIKKQIQELQGIVRQIRGQIQGLTLLSSPEGCQFVEDEARLAEVEGPNSVNIILKTNIEAIIIKWTHEVSRSRRQFITELLCGRWMRLFAWRARRSWRRAAPPAPWRSSSSGRRAPATWRVCMSSSLPATPRPWQPCWG